MGGGLQISEYSESVNIIDTISGGIFTARPWVAGGALSEGDESEEENVEKLQGIIRFGVLK